jgi:hypothetical protein
VTLRYRLQILACVGGGVALFIAGARGQQLDADRDQPNGPLEIRIQLPDASPAPLSGRLVVLMTDEPTPVDVITPDVVPDDHLWIAAREVKNAEPRSTITIGPSDVFVPSPLTEAPVGDYRLMALLDVDHNANYEFMSPGDIRSSIVRVSRLDTRRARPITLRLAEPVPGQPARLRAEGQLFEMVSPAVSAFWGQPTRLRYVVILPPGYRTSSARYPTVYITHGFGSTLENSAEEFVNLLATQMASGKLPPMIWVVLEQVVPGGTHEFANSANNGPWGTALTQELIPDLERRYRMDGRPSGRLLNGHSSGGWATAWLQIAYPDVFGGTWSTSPDPLDFHEFTNVDLYSRTNLYRDEQGVATRLLRSAEGEPATLARFARREAVLGDYGGQLGSFEWVFSPRGPDGRPRQLFDRATGLIDREVATYWIERFDLARRLRVNAATLVPKLRGKLHFVVGTSDTFYLDRGVRRMQQAIEPLGYDAKFTYLDGRNHFDLYDGDLMASIAAQMYAVARPHTKWRAPSNAPPLAQTTVRCCSACPQLRPTPAWALAPPTRTAFH